MRHILACIASVLGSGCTIGPTGPAVERPGVILSSGGTVLTEAELISALSEARIVIIGEVHDNPVHHARQARLVGALGPAGIAFEMVPGASEEGVQVFLAEGGARDQIGPSIGWERLGWPDWGMYAPIFAAAPGAYVAGGAVRRADLRLAIRSGATVAYGDGAEAMGLGQPLDPEIQTEIETDMIVSHCNKLPREAARGMVQAQRLRDASFAAATLRALAAGGGQEGSGQAVLITGNGHARIDRGVPVYLRLASPGIAVLSVGMIELQPGADPAAAGRGLPYDFVWFSEPAKRDDPCAGFG